MSETPIVVSYGGGTNSTAMLVGMHERGMRPALIMFADTGDERPETYAHLDAVQLWLTSAGFPRIVVVRNMLPQGVTDGSLSGECLRLGTMPSKVTGYSSCSKKWKVDPQTRYLRAWMTERGIGHVEQYIGFDAGESGRAVRGDKSVESHKTNRYPLIEWGWGREECVGAIARAGLKQPGKSACWMCPSSRKPEVLWLKQTHASLYARAIEIERRALSGEGDGSADYRKIVGLGRHWNWQSAMPAACQRAIFTDSKPGATITRGCTPACAFLWRSA